MIDGFPKFDFDNIGKKIVNGFRIFLTEITVAKAFRYYF